MLVRIPLCGGIVNPCGPADFPILPEGGGPATITLEIPWLRYSGYNTGIELWLRLHSGYGPSWTITRVAPTLFRNTRCHFSRCFGKYVGVTKSQEEPCRYPTSCGCATRTDFATEPSPRAPPSPQNRPGHPRRFVQPFQGWLGGHHAQPRVTLRGFAATLTLGCDVSSLRDGPMPVNGHEIIATYARCTSSTTKSNPSARNVCSVGTPVSASQPMASR